MVEYEGVNLELSNQQKKQTKRSSKKVIME